ncbi:bifunctional adenosylcobinamide kinase/adenosylcobinamide-phosphate guanylyltransferase, partial [Mesorhizobium sp. M0520]
MPDRAAGALTLVIGGGRAGTGAHAESLVTVGPPPWSYIA